jgi:hypothetical protein
MSDPRELARQIDVRLRSQVRLAPAEELIAAGRRRTRRRRTFGAIGIVVLCAVVALAAAPIWRHAPAATTAASPASLQHRVVLDGGALILDPPGDSAGRPRVTEAQARAVGPQVQYPFLGEPLNLVLARVTAHVQSRPAGVPATWQLAWVELYRISENGPSASCPMPASERPPAPSPAGTPTNENALIIDAMTGAATMYLGYGIHVCPPAALPVVEVARADYSVPFDVQPDGSLLVHLPPCGEMSGAGRGPSTGSGGKLAAGEFEVLATVPIGPCTKPPSIVNFGSADQQLPIKHAPVGPIVRQDGELVIQPSPTR